MLWHLHTPLFQYTPVGHSQHSICKALAKRSRLFTIERRWPNALDFSLYNARHACWVKCRERLATLLSEVESSVICRVKFGQAQNCRALLSIVESVWPQTIQSRAYACAVEVLFPDNSLIIWAVHERLFVNFLISLSVRTGNRREECSIGVQSPFEGD